MIWAIERKIKTMAATKRGIISGYYSIRTQESSNKERDYSKVTIPYEHRRAATLNVHYSYNRA